MIALALVGLVGVVVVAILAASVVLQGPRLAGIIQGFLPESRGKLSLGGVDWSLRALVDIVTDAPSPVSVDGLRIVDPEGTIVLDVPHLDARIKLRTLIAGSFSIHDLKVGKAIWRFAQMQKTPEIGFVAALASKAPALPPSPISKTEPSGPGSYFEIVDAELADLNALFDFPGAWGLELRHARANASLKQSNVDRKHPFFGFDAGPVIAEGGGWLRIMDDNLLPFDRVAITRIATTPERSDDIFLDLREAKTGRSTLTGKGYFTGIYGATSTPGIDLHAEFHEAADAFNQVIAGKKIEGLVLSGETASAVVDLTQSFAKIQVAARFAGLDVAFAPYRALGVGFGLKFDGEAMAVALSDFGLSAPGGGNLKLKAKFDIAKMKLGADVALAQFTTDSYVPAALQPLAGGTVSGAFHSDADLGTATAAGTGTSAGPTVSVRGLDLRLDRRHAAGLPRTVRAHGDARWSPASAKTSGVTIEIAGARATAQGEVKLTRQLLSLGLEVVAFDLAKTMAAFGLPAVGQSAEVRATVDGPWSSPHATGTLKATGLGVGARRLPQLNGRFGLEQGLAKLDSLSGEAFGGRVDAHGTVRLYEKTTRRPLKSPEVDAHLSLKNIDLAAATASDAIAGRVSLSAEATGPANNLRAQITVPAGQALKVADQSFLFGPAKLSYGEHRVSIQELHVALPKGEGQSAIGTLDITGTITEAPKRKGPSRKGDNASNTSEPEVDVDVVLASVDLADLPGVSDSGVDVQGTVGAKMHIAGSLSRPQITGTIQLAKVSARGIALGDGAIRISPDPESAAGTGIALLAQGDLFNRLRVDVKVAQRIAAPTGIAVHGSVDFTKVVLESIVPELAELGDGRGIVSGRARVDIEPGQALNADLTLSEFWVSMARAIDAAPGEEISRRVEVRATQPVHVVVNGDRIVLDDMRLATNGGVLSARGRLEGKRVEGSLDGHLDLELIQPFIRENVERVSGDLDLKVNVAGTIASPEIRGKMNVGEAIHIRPIGFDTDVIVSSGAISLSPDAAELSGLRVSVDGPVMQVDGRVKLGSGFKPLSVEAKVAGEISARLLSYVAGESVSDAQGRARIKAEVKGPLTNPILTAWLGLGSITFRLRDSGNEIEVQSGVVEVSNSGALLRDVRVLIDDQGKLSIGAAGVRPGQVEFLKLFPLKIGRVDFPLHGEQLVYRSPGSFEINDLNLTGDLEDGFELGGDVRIISGRYTQDFVLGNLVLSPRTNESAVHPFYEGKPLLANMPLDLTVRTVGDAFVVQNNIAPEIHVDVALSVGGTVSAPELTGDVRPTDGRFQIPVLRGYFDLIPNASHVTFVGTKSLADGETPDIQIEAQNSVIDAAGTEHIVKMSIHGPVREMQIDLSTADGLDRSQTALLLLTGRTTTNSDRLSTQNPTVGANLNTGLDIAGQATRDAIANLMEPIIGDTFERAVGLQLRLTVGPDGFEGRLRKQVSREFRLQADTLFGFQGQSRWTLQGEWWLVDYLSVLGGWQRQTLTLQPGLNESLPVNGSLELRWDFPIRR